MLIAISELTKTHFGYWQSNKWQRVVGQSLKCLKSRAKLSKPWNFNELNPVVESRQTYENTGKD